MHRRRATKTTTQPYYFLSHKSLYSTVNCFKSISRNSIPSACSGYCSSAKVVC